MDIIETYYNNDFSLVPTPYKGKGAMMKDWINNNLDSLQKYEEFVKKYNRKFNVSILTGKKGLFVIDVDIKYDEHGNIIMNGEKSLKSLETKLGKLPDTPTVITGSKGKHLYFYILQNINVSSKANFFGNEYPGIDIRYTGAKVVAPPSVHENGNKYYWENGKSLIDLKIAKLPENWLNYIQNQNNVSLKKDIADVIKKGTRNETLFKLACSFSKKLPIREYTEILINEINETKCETPLPREEVKKIVDSAYKYKEKENNKKSVEIFTLEELNNEEIPEIQWFVKDLIPSGVHLIAGKPKAGKSWLALNLAGAISSGVNFIGLPVKKNKVLYLALEDTKARLKHRYKNLENIFLYKENISFATAFPNINEGGIEELEKLISENKYKIVIIDTLFHFKGLNKKFNLNAYEVDYDVLKRIKELADKYEIAIIIIHHLNKSRDNDMYSRISGSTAMQGGVDTMFILENNNETLTLSAKGRDIEEKELSLKNVNGFIVLNDNKYNYLDKLTLTRKKIVSLLESDKEKIFTSKEIKECLNIERSKLQQNLKHLVNNKYIEKVDTGKYKYSTYYDEIA